MSTLGRKAPSISGSRASIYSHASTVRTLRTQGTGRASKGRPAKLPWWRKPIVHSALYTDLQRGSWHIGFYTLFLSAFTIFTDGFNLYCLHEAAPGSSHTGYYIFSFDFVFVGNAHVRNLLIISSVFSVIAGVVLLITSVMLLDALRKEQETAFKGWLYIMAFFTPWKWLAWLYAGIVNDIIFGYNILMLIAWFGFNVLNTASFICIWSLYLELNDLTKLQDLAKLKMDTMSSMPASRAASSFGSRPVSPYGTHETLRQQQLAAANAQYQYHQPQMQQQQQVEPAYGYSRHESDIM